MAILIGIDTGGTYTDAVLFDEQQGVVQSAKSLTTKHDLSIGVRQAVQQVLPEPRPDIGLVSLSTTLATNAIVEGQGAPVCLILIGQREDALDRAGLGKALGGDPVIHLAGGHTADGSERAPLDLEAAREAILAVVGRVSAFAVAGYFAVRNPAHEVALRDLVRELTGAPVTCSHELSSNLDAPRRALTAVLNARLIPLLQELVQVVRDMLESWRIDAPLMVVMGDGSLTTSDTALARPVETILSGPAASVVGARYLCGERNGYVVDIGGTTTDIALLEDGWPALNLDGATVAGWRTMVQAVDVHTEGIGGDSEVRIADGAELRVGPRRVLPLSLLVYDHPGALGTLNRQLERGYPRTHDGRFALRQRRLSETPAGITTGEGRVWEALAGGPIAVDSLLSTHPLERQLEGLVRKGLVLISAFCPTDAAHVLGLHDGWSKEAASVGARLWARRGDISGWQPHDDAVEFSRCVLEQLTVQSGETIIGAAMQDQLGMNLDRAQPLARAMVNTSLRRAAGERDLLRISVQLNRPLIAIGAPAATYYHDIAERLACPLEVPPNAEVCNAVGAVASGVMRGVDVTITSPDQGRFRVHLPDGPADFPGWEAALAHAERCASEAAVTSALDAGADQPEVKIARTENIAELGGGEKMFLECTVHATAVGRPRLSKSNNDAA